jgi:hypothetical protein
MKWHLYIKMKCVTKDAMAPVYQDLAQDAMAPVYQDLSLRMQWHLCINAMAPVYQCNGTCISRAVALTFVLTIL